MIVRHFLQWVRSAPAGERADATSALARAFLHSDLSADDRAAAEGAMLMLLDDPSPLVRGALADSLAASDAAPPAVIFALAGDQFEVAQPVLERSPLMVDADLVDAVATGSPQVQAAIARRFWLQRSVSAAIAEVGTSTACLVLAENATADLAPFSFHRLAERFGDLPAIRTALLARPDLPAATRQALVALLSRQLADFVAGREWLAQDHAHRVAREACEKATVTLAAESPAPELRPMVRHLRESGQLNAGLLLRALLSGNVVLFEEALADLADMPLARVVRIIHDKGGAAFRALYDRAGLPESAYPGFREAIRAMREIGFAEGPGGTTRLKRRVVERVLTGCAEKALGDIEPLMMLLRRFAAEAAREEARLFCDGMVQDREITPVLTDERVAA
jgi:uncharacterized protein (DUF2336 family)